MPVTVISRPFHTNSLGSSNSPIAIRSVLPAPTTGLMASLTNRSGMGLLFSIGFDAAVRFPHGTGSEIV